MGRERTQKGVALEMRDSKTGNYNRCQKVERAPKRNLVPP